MPIGIRSNNPINNNSMDNNENKMVECILRIQNANFNKDLKVDIREDLLDDDSWEFQDIYNGASQTLLQKYLPQMKAEGTIISLLRPFDIDQDDFIEFMEEADVNKAQADIKAILEGLPEAKRKKLLAQLNK